MLGVDATSTKELHSSLETLVFEIREISSECLSKSANSAGLSSYEQGLKNLNSSVATLADVFKKEIQQRRDILSQRKRETFNSLAFRPSVWLPEEAKRVSRFDESADNAFQSLLASSKSLANDVQTMQRVVASTDIIGGAILRVADRLEEAVARLEVTLRRIPLLTSRSRRALRKWYDNTCGSHMIMYSHKGLRTSLNRFILRRVFGQWGAKTRARKAHRNQIWKMMRRIGYYRIMRYIDQWHGATKRNALGKLKKYWGYWREEVRISSIQKQSIRDLSLAFRGAMIYSYRIRMYASLREWRSRVSTRRKFRRRFTNLVYRSLEGKSRKVLRIWQVACSLNSRRVNKKVADILCNQKARRRKSLLFEKWKTQTETTIAQANRLCVLYFSVQKRILFESVSHWRKYVLDNKFIVEQGMKRYLLHYFVKWRSWKFIVEKNRSNRLLADLTRLEQKEKHRKMELCLNSWKKFVKERQEEDATTRENFRVSWRKFRLKGILRNWSNIVYDSIVKRMIQRNQNAKERAFKGWKVTTQRPTGHVLSTEKSREGSYSSIGSGDYSTESVIESGRSSKQCLDGTLLAIQQAVKCNRVDTALEIYNNIVSVGRVADKPTYDLLLVACLQESRFTQACDIIVAMAVEHFDIDVVLFTELLTLGVKRSLLATVIDVIECCCIQQGYNLLDDATAEKVLLKAIEEGSIHDIDRLHNAYVSIGIRLLPEVDRNVSFIIEEAM